MTAVRFGVQLTSVHGGDDPPALQVQEHTDLVRRAEALGFDLICAGQHFLTPELRYYQPLPYLSYLAGLTSRVRLVTGILLMPLHNPVDIAEQVATLDVVSGGRAVMGVGLGYADHEFRAFGIDRRTRVSRLVEAIEVVRAVWSGNGEPHAGRHFTVDSTATGVRPVQRPGPPIWAAGQSEVAVRRAARIADGWYVPPFLTHDELAAYTKVFDEARDAAGLAPPLERPVRRELVIADSMEEALAGAAARSTSRMGTYVKWGMGRDYAADRLTSATEESLRSRFVVGTPADCAEQLLEIQAGTGMTHFVLKPQWPGLPHAAAVEQVERFAAEVAPLITAA